MPYEWPTQRAGIYGHHADRCPQRDGELCTCGPLGYRVAVDDPRDGTTLLSPVLDDAVAAERWRRDQYAGLDAARTIAGDDLRVSSVIESFLDGAEDGLMRDAAGRRYGAAALRELRWTLEGHVAQELGPMPIRDVRRVHLQALIAELHESGLSAARVSGVLDALRALYDFAVERDLVESNPVQTLGLPSDEADLRSQIGTTVDLDAVDAPGPTPTPAHQHIPLETALSWGVRLAVMMFVLIALVLVAESV
jgi:hypothetical protein